MIKNRNIDDQADIDPGKILGGLGQPIRRDAKYIYVDSNNGSDTLSGTSRTAAKGTLAGALLAATAGKGDVIFLMPGHAESIINATGTILSVSGVSIIGLGTGALRPTFTFTTANTANIPVTAANITVKNVLFVGNFLSIASVFTATSTNTPTDFTVDGCSFRDVDSTHGFLSIVTGNATANSLDRLRFINNRIDSLSASWGPAIVILSTTNGARVEDNFINHGGAAADVANIMSTSSFNCTAVEVARNQCYCKSTTASNLLISTSANGFTGLVHDNYVKHFTASAAVMITAGSKVGEFNNLGTGDSDTSGYVLPAIGAN